MDEVPGIIAAPARAAVVLPKKFLRDNFLFVIAIIISSKCLKFGVPKVPVILKDNKRNKNLYNVSQL
jgi:hypothetical protein